MHAPGRPPLSARTSAEDVAVTANATAEDAQECMAAGMDDFLTKPIKALELCKCLERWRRQLAAGRPADSGPPANGHAATDGVRRPMRPTLDRRGGPGRPARYVHLLDDPRRNAADTVGAIISAAETGSPGATVVTLGRQDAPEPSEDQARLFSYLFLDELHSA
jgi:hypothetical protein